MPILDDILVFIAEETGCDCKRLRSDGDIFKFARIEADDCFTLIHNFGKRFNVDLTEYLWYFHHSEEGTNIGSFFVKSPDQRVKRIPVTPNLLLESAQEKRWVCQYPEHRLPKTRADILINQIVFLSALVLVLILILLK